MNERVKKLWVEALRSGAYRQTHGVLRTSNEPDAYCCLGVLTDLYCKETRSTWGEALAGHEDECLPPRVRVWAGTDSEDPDLNDGAESRSASGFNDDGTSFTEIADMIERSL